MANPGFWSGSTSGLDRLSAKLTAIPPAILQAAKGALEQNAVDFESQVAAIIPVDTGELVSTLAHGPGKGPVSVQVSIGGPAAPYPAHLEFGHMDHGTHVPAEPFWFTTLRVNRRRFKSRLSRAVSAAIKRFTAAGG